MGLLRRFFGPTSAWLRAAVSFTIEVPQMRAEVGEILAKEILLKGEMADLTNAMGITQRALMRIRTQVADIPVTLHRIETHAAHLLVASERLEHGTADFPATLHRIETHAAHLLVASQRLEHGTTDLPATLHRIETHAAHILVASERLEHGTADLPTTLHRIETHAAHLLAASSEAATERQELLERFSSAIDRLSVRDDTIRLALDAIRVDQRRSDESARLALDAIRVDQQRLDESARLAVHAARADQRQIGEAIREQIQAVEAASALIDEKILYLLNKSDQVLGLAAVQISKLDTLTQRVVLPLGPDVLMRIPEGLLLIPADDAALVATVWEAGGRLEKGTSAVATALVEDGDEVIDVGANVGLLTIALARRVGASGRVTAVEPSSRVADLLRRSVFLNFGPGRVEVHHCAAGASSGTATLNIGPTAGRSSLLPLRSSRGTEQVEVRTLDDIVPPGTRLRLVKIDVEGFEPEVWRGMTRILSESPDLAVIVEFGTEHLRRADIGVGAWLDVFGSAGFSAFEIDEETGTVAPLRTHEELAEVVSVNLLLLRRPVSTHPRLKTR